MQSRLGTHPSKTEVTNYKQKSLREKREIVVGGGACTAELPSYCPADNRCTIIGHTCSGSCFQIRAHRREPNILGVVLVHVQGGRQALADPGVLPDLRQRYPLVGVHLEELREQIQNFWRRLGPWRDVVLTCSSIPNVLTALSKPACSQLFFLANQPASPLLSLFLSPNSRPASQPAYFSALVLSSRLFLSPHSQSIFQPVCSFLALSLGQPAFSSALCITQPTHAQP
jgi:hypothetical protein